MQTYQDVRMTADETARLFRQYVARLVTDTTAGRHVEDTRPASPGLERSDR